MITEAVSSHGTQHSMLDNCTALNKHCNNNDEPPTLQHSAITHAPIGYRKYSVRPSEGKLKYRGDPCESRINNQEGKQQKRTPPE